MPWVDEDKCVGCALCVQKCPEKNAIFMRSNKKAYIDNSVCTRCGICMEVCPKNAIRPNSENPSLKGQGRGAGMGKGGGNGLGRGHGRGMGKGRF